MNRLFIAEKPSLGRAIAAGLGKQSPSKGYISCGNDVVTWCFGHLLEVAPPEYYDQNLKQWKQKDLPIIPDKLTLLPNKDSKEQLGVIKKLLKECKTVVNAGDPDREGQLLVDEVLEYLGWKGPCERIWLAALDPENVAKALANLADNKKYTGYRDAADSRRTVDWLGGINLTRAMTLFGRGLGMDGVLSLGRVQTPTLRIVVDRDREIQNFKPVDFAKLEAEIIHANGTFKANFVIPEGMDGVDPEGRLIDFAVAQKIANAAKGLPGSITHVEKKAEKNAPPLPFSLASLQIKAGASLGLGAQDVLNAAQSLYEKQLTSYPRTDCEYLPEEQFKEAGKIITTLRNIPSISSIADKADLSLKSRAWNSAKITAHHAIIPTGIKPGGLNATENSLYELIATNYLLQFWPVQECEATKIIVTLENKSVWSANGRVVKNPGWTAAVKDDKKSDRILPSVAKGDRVDCKDVVINRSKTTPPPHFTEGTLIQAMKNIHLFIQDPEAKKKLKETSGIGTEATRASILETLKKRNYLATQGKSLLSTAKGQNVIDMCPPAIKDIATTAQLEDILTDVLNGKTQPETAVKAYAETLAPMIDALFSLDVSGLNIALPKSYPCPDCGSPLKHIRSKKSKKLFWICSKDGCGCFMTDVKGRPGQKIVKSSAEVSETEKCPKCGKPLAKRQNKAGGFFWSCTGYPKCNFAVNDDNGKPQILPPGALEEHKCPQCGAVMRYGVNKNGKPYWMCKVQSKKHKTPGKIAFFNADEDGRPVLS